VGVEGEVVGDEGQVRCEERLKPSFQPPVDYERFVAPEDPVVHDDELRFRCACAFKQLARARDSAHELRHLVGAGDLQSRPAVFGERFDVEQLIRKPDDVVSAGHRPPILCGCQCVERGLVPVARIEELNTVCDDLDRGAPLTVLVLPRPAP
jgi:hypothetical protein